MKKSLLFLPVLLFTGVLFSQDIPAPKFPQGVSMSNQMKASYDLELKRAIFEDWLNIDYRYAHFRRE